MGIELPNYIPRTLLFAVSLCQVYASAAEAPPAVELPAGAVLEIRLLRALGTTVSSPGQPVHGVVIAPVLAGSAILVPQGAIVSGSVAAVRRVGLGFVRESASLDLNLDTLNAGGVQVKVPMRLAGAGTAKETVDAKGRLRGVRPTDAFSYRTGSFPWRVGFLVAPFFAWEQWAAKTVLLPIPEPEIHFPAGAELRIRVEQSVSLPDNWELHTQPDNADPQLAAAAAALPGPNHFGPPEPAGGYPQPRVLGL